MAVCNLGSQIGVVAARLIHLLVGSGLALQLSIAGDWVPRVDVAGLGRAQERRRVQR